MNAGIGGIAIMGVIGLAFFVPIILGGLGVLQFFLSRRDSKWIGLLLPTILLGFSGLIFSGRLLYPSSWNYISAVLIGVIVFLPPALLFAEHFIIRLTKKPDDLDKMKIQDLS